MGIARSTYYHEPKGTADDTALVEAMHAIKDEFEAYGDPPPSNWSTLRLRKEEDRRWQGSVTSLRRS